MLHFKSLFADVLFPYIPELTHEQIMNLIEIPPQGLWADLAFPCFSLAKTRGQSPVQIALSFWGGTTKNPVKQENSWIINWLDPSIPQGDNPTYTLEAKGPYINISFSPSFVFEQLKTYNSTLITPKDKLVLIESPSPNTNKPLHLGHVRNMILWNALAKIMTADGYDIKKVEVINDRGIHICKSMLAYKLFWNNAEPDKKSDHFVGDRYVRYATEEEKDPTLKEQAQEILRAREAGDPEVKALWKKMNTRAIDGMKKTYTRYGTHIDDATLESDVYTDGKDVAEKGLSQGVFVRDPKGNIALPLAINEEETSYFVVLRSDGTTLYATQDLALVDHRFKTYNMNKMVYIVGNEQDDYFRALFKCFKGLRYPFADQCHHLSYGMIELPNGKMKSRTGNVIDADNLIDELHQTSYEEIKKRYPDLEDNQAHERAEKIALGAINFFMLKIDPAKGFVFDPAESLSFEGETGPYIQYTYARSGAILNKAKEWNYTIGDKNISSYCEENHKPLLFHISQLNDMVSKASEEYKPSLLCRYALDLCQMINSFYQQGKILDPENLELSAYRLYLLSSARTILGQVMDLICIPRVEVM